MNVMKFGNIKNPSITLELKNKNDKTKRIVIGFPTTTTEIDKCVEEMDCPRYIDVVENSPFEKFANDDMYDICPITILSIYGFNNDIAVLENLIKTNDSRLPKVKELFFSSENSFTITECFEHIKNHNK